jgi:hypothetical protein
MLITLGPAEIAASTAARTSAQLPKPVSAERRLTAG